jgi:hypothetical protein
MMAFGFSFSFQSTFRSLKDVVSKSKELLSIVKVVSR